MIEIGKGSKVKYELDKKSGLIKVYLPSIYPNASVTIDVFIANLCGGLKSLILCSINFF